MDSHLLQKPYADRQLIVIAPDEVVRAEEKAKSETTRDNSSSYWSSIAGLTTGMLEGFIPGGLIVHAVFEAIKAWNKARDNGVPILTVSRSEAENSRLKLPIGHPRDGVVYVGDPAAPPVYYTLASFHRLCFEEKFCEVISLMMALGATDIIVEHVTGWNREFAIGLSVPIDSVNLQAGVGHSSQSRSHLLFKASLPGSTEPNIPEGMVWYASEPTWRQIAQARIDYGLKDFSLGLRYEDDFGVNAGLKLKVEKAGLELGGRFEDHQATVWKIEGRFLTK